MHQLPFIFWKLPPKMKQKEYLPRDGLERVIFRSLVFCHLRNLQSIHIKCDHLCVKQVKQDLKVGCATIAPPGLLVEHFHDTAYMICRLTWHVHGRFDVNIGEWQHLSPICWSVNANVRSRWQSFLKTLWFVRRKESRSKDQAKGSFSLPQLA